MNLKTKGLAKKLIVAITGLIICGIGVGIFLYSGLGVDPASVFELGIAKVFNITYGTSAALINVVILLIVLVVDKSYISISSLLAIFGIGYTADFVNLLLGLFLKGTLPMLIRLVMVFIGLFIMSVGIATYICGDLGVGAIDLISEIISNKLHIAYRIVRVSVDVALVALGFVLGGTVGIGTVIAAVLTGPVVQLVRPHICRMADSFLGNRTNPV